MQELTLVYLLKDDTVCLGYKARGLGDGYWNGFGGKVEVDETIATCAVRELHEETTVRAKEDDLEKVAENQFFFTDGMHLQVHVFFLKKWEGTVSETDEMRTPTWFSCDTLPYKNMWQTDPHWFPRVLNGEKLRGSATFLADGKTVETKKWETVSGF